MKISKNMTKIVTPVLFSVALLGCESNPIKDANIALVDAKSRGHLQTKLTMADYVALAETVTNKMLSSRLVAKWGSKSPRVIAAVPVNNTDNEGVRMSDLHDRIQETLLGSGVLRVVDKSATSFDYIIKSELTTTRQYGKDGKELVHYTLQLKMFTLMGELVGQWSDDLAMARGKKKWY